MRVVQSLDGLWQFRSDPDERYETAQGVQFDREITVPMPWQAAFHDLRQYSGYAWYQRSFTLTDEDLYGEVLLTFGAVDYWCEVFVNGQRVGEHEGGYVPFTLPVRAFAQAGENLLTVRVFDPVQNFGGNPRWALPGEGANTAPPFAAEHVPHGKQEWYLNVGGLWQSVTLSIVPSTYIAHVRLTPDPVNGQVEAVITLEGEPPQVGSVRLTVNGQRAEISLTSEMVYTLRLTVPNIQLWTLENPHLYDAEVTLTLDGGVSDHVKRRIGFRTFTTANGQFFLNGEPLYLLSALDQDLYADTIYTVPSEQYLRDQFQRAKELGLNCLRCHIKPPDPQYLDMADEMGLLIWAEIPSWRTFHIKSRKHSGSVTVNDALRQRVEDTLQGMIARDSHHASLVIWTIVNEDWGTALELSPTDRAWISEVADLCRTLDPHRLVVDNSPCPAPWGLSVHVNTDLDDFHYYTNIPDAADGWEQIVTGLASRPLWSFSNHDDARRTGQEPLVLSEFGNWGLPTLKALETNGRQPHWFDLGAWWSGWDGEPSYPHGVSDRFAELGLNAIWRDYDAFAEASQWHQFNALKFEIEVMRRQPALSGYVITELSDIYWESNGLLDFNRAPKVYHNRLAEFNTPDVVAPKLSRYSYWDDEAVTLPLYGSRYSAATWAQLRVVSGDINSELALPAIERGSVAELGVVGLPLPSATRADIQRVELMVLGEQGETVVNTGVDLLVLPASWRQAAYTEPVGVFSLRDQAPAAAQVWLGAGDAPAAVPAPVDTLDSQLSALGYTTVSAGDSGLLVTDTPNADVLNWVRQGGRLLYLCDGINPFYWYIGRGGTYSGNWMSAFSWLKPAAHARLGTVPQPLSLPFKDVMPHGTLVALPTDDSRYHNDFLAGQFTGWVGHPATHTVQFRYGAGRVLMTTFALRRTLAYQPVAAAMLHDLFDYLANGPEPVLRGNY